MSTLYFSIFDVNTMPLLFTDKNVPFDNFALF